MLGVRLSNPLGFGLGVLSAAACFTGLMMLIATLGRTEQAVAGAGWAILLVMSMTGGGMVPLFAMPGFMQTASHLSPVKWAVLGFEGAIWRGFGWGEMLVPCAVLVTVGVIAFVIGERNLRRME